MLVFSLGGFGIGTTEFVSMGLLNMIAKDFAVTEDTAGHIISGYALGVVIGAPVLAALTGKIPRRRLLLFLMAAFSLGNGLTMLAHNYPTLLLARFIAGFPHGAYFSVAGLSAASMAPKGERGRALAFVGMGLSVSLVFGVPLAQGLGQALGWKAAYGVVTLIGIITVVSLWFLMPHMTEMKPTNPHTELGALGKPQVWLTVLMGTVGFGGMFAVYTYISWTMTERAGLPAELMPLVLTMYGIGSVVGNWLGGRLADRDLEKGILLAFSLIAVALVGFYITSTHPILGSINFGFIGLCGSALIPSLQIRLMEVAGKAQTLAAALNQSALNLANAGGAALGGAVIAAGYSYSAPALAGAGLAILAMIMWVPAYLLRRQDILKNSR
ncbi:MFS transporter [Corynebacterium poyangense]|uniref:MFS transporter n=2 Tax=Corynebacterium poyangense TaxID=2684405 RepID=A0A7H0SS46_9CORY|nr:MFS transporter [Corynebacterium poyangense]QNQ91371.1 MFS transporter [Corynebacterium poyangense]